MTLNTKGNKISVLIKKKDILEELLENSGIDYINILPEGRSDSKWGIALGLAKRDLRLLQYCILNRPDLMVGTSVEIGHIGTLLRIPSINVNEDDFDVVPLYSKLSYPWSTFILTPSVCRNGRWESKSLKYDGYHELAYLHPGTFTPSMEVLKKYTQIRLPYFILRFAKLNAHHDKGMKGITDEIALEIIRILKPHGNVYITSERDLSDKLESYHLKITPNDMHHILAFSSLFIGDSQTMAMEAGVLGVPFIRFNDFVGRISVLNELENKYELGFGVRSDDVTGLYDTIRSLIKIKNLREVFQLRRRKMLSEKINLSSYMIWLLENYPGSINQ